MGSSSSKDNPSSIHSSSIHSSSIENETKVKNFDFKVGDVVSAIVGAESVRMISDEYLRVGDGETVGIVERVFETPPSSKNAVVKFFHLINKKEQSFHQCFPFWHLNPLEVPDLAVAQSCIGKLVYCSPLDKIMLVKQVLPTRQLVLTDPTLPRSVDLHCYSWNKCFLETESSGQFSVGDLIVCWKPHRNSIARYARPLVLSSPTQGAIQKIFGSFVRLDTGDFVNVVNDSCLKCFSVGTEVRPNCSYLPVETVGTIEAVLPDQRVTTGEFESQDALSYLVHFQMLDQKFRMKHSELIPSSYGMDYPLHNEEFHTKQVLEHLMSKIQSGQLPMAQKHEVNTNSMENAKPDDLKSNSIDHSEFYHSIEEASRNDDVDMNANSKND